jgi:SLT domain-containing protein
MVQNVSLHSYLYYNTSSPSTTSVGKAASGGDNKPLTASHTFPNGGAIQMLEMHFNEKKAEGINNISAACEVRLVVLDLFCW